MLPIFLSGGVVMTIYFAWELPARQAWGAFGSEHSGRNFTLILAMAFLHYAASAAFAYSAFRIGAFGNTVGYAIFNTASVLVAVITAICRSPPVPIGRGITWGLCHKETDIVVDPAVYFKFGLSKRQRDRMREWK